MNKEFQTTNEEKEEIINIEEKEKIKEPKKEITYDRKSPGKSKDPNKKKRQDKKYKL